MQKSKINLKFKIAIVIFVLLTLIFIAAVIAGFGRKLPKNSSFGQIKNLSTLISGFKTESYEPEEISVEKIFRQDHSWTATLSAGRKTTLLVTGDVILGRMVNVKMNQYKDFSWPFRKTADFLRKADITFANFEAPLVTNCPATSKGMVFCGDRRGIEGLKLAGIKIVSLANNHLENYGTEGLRETEKSLDEAGILYTGVENKNGCMEETKRRGNFTGIKANGLTFGFLGYSAFSGSCLANADEELIKKEVKEAKDKADILTVMFHWGEEYTASPTARQINLAHASIDAGADLVLGNHPHWPQGVEVYKQKLIAYSHGNFVFDQMWSRETREGVIGKYTFYDKKLTDAQFFPILIEDYGQPGFLAGKEAEIILKRMRSNSISDGY